MAKKMKAISPNFEEELGKTPPSDSQLKSVSTSVMEAVALIERIAKGEELLKKLKSKLHLLTTRSIVDAMRAARTEEFSVTGGISVSLNSFMNGSLPKDPVKRTEALNWLEKNGAKDLIKTEFELALGRGQLKDAKALRVALKKLGLTYKSSEGVHAQSLYAFARERMKKGKELPLELLGIYSGTVAKIDIPKKGD